MPYPRRLLSIVVALIASITLTLGAVSPARSTDAPVLVPGATFAQLDDLGVAGSTTYIYRPSDPWNPGAMLTPVFFVYSEDGYASKDAAWEAVSEEGLVALAERERAVIIVQNPMEGAWGTADVDVYQGVLSHIWGGNSAASGKPALSFYRLNYVFGEGAGATFINEHMTQSPQVERIAGVATFGGAVSSEPADSAVPAFVVGGSNAAAAFYKAANDVNVHATPRNTPYDIYYDSKNAAKKVIVSDSGATELTESLINQAYELLFRYTARQGLSTALWDLPNSPEDLTLMQRPNLEELDLTQNLVDGADTGVTGQPRWYEWVPNEVLTGMQAGSAKTYPLVIDLHGRGDHEIYEAESNGWIELAGKKKVIVVAPFDETEPAVMAMLEVIKRKYPVDLSRIYMTGYSMGANNTFLISSAHPDVFAAIAPQSSPSARPLATLEERNDVIDLPTFYSAATEERDAVQRPNGTTFLVPELKLLNREALNRYMRLNNIAPPSSYDFVKHPIYGFERNDYREYGTRWGYDISTSTLSNSAGVPLMELALGHGLAHTHYMDYAPIAWDFLSAWTRDPETKATGYTDASALPALEEVSVNQGSLSPAFDPDVLAYTVDVRRNVSSVSIKVAPAPPGSTVDVAGRVLRKGVGATSVTLGAPGGSTDVPITVTSPDGIELTYTVTVHRQG